MGPLQCNSDKSIRTKPRQLAGKTAAPAATCNLADTPSEARVLKGGAGLCTDSRLRLLQICVLTRMACMLLAAVLQRAAARWCRSVC